ncbi:hypothetical protein LguiB_021726 [Lonicera macranthoides]
MASQQAPARPRFLSASLPAPAQPSNQVPQPRPSFMTRSTTFGQNLWLPITAQPPPSAAVAPPPLSATAAPPAAAPRAAVVPVIPSSSVPPLFQPRIFSTPKSPLPNSHVPKLVSPSPKPSPPPSSFQASLGVSITAPTTITTAPPTTPNSFPKINKSHPSNTPSQSPRTSPISLPPSPPCEINKKHYSDSKDSGVMVITLAGDNEGATVKLSSSRKKGYSVEISDKEGNSNQNPGVGFEINSSVQGVKNSTLHNSSLTHHSPGVHLSVYSKANGATNE